MKKGSIRIYFVSKLSLMKWQRFQFFVSSSRGTIVVSPIVGSFIQTSTQERTHPVDNVKIYLAFIFAWRLARQQYRSNCYTLSGRYLLKHGIVPIVFTHFSWYFCSFLICLGVILISSYVEYFISLHFSLGTPRFFPADDLNNNIGSLAWTAADLCSRRTQFRLFGLEDIYVGTGLMAPFSHCLYDSLYQIIFEWFSTRLLFPGTINKSLVPYVTKLFQGLLGC